MNRWVGMGLALLLAGCAVQATGTVKATKSSPQPSATPKATSSGPSPSPLPSSPVTAAKLDGTWTPAGDTRSGVISYATCNENEDLYTFKQDGQALTVSRTPTHFGGGAQFAPGPNESLTGTNANGTVHLSGGATEGTRPDPSASPTPVSYDLSFDAATQHLKGTRNGEPVELAPLILQGRDPKCPNVP